MKKRLLCLFVAAFAVMALAVTSFAHPYEHSLFYETFKDTQRLAYYGYTQGEDYIDEPNWVQSVCPYCGAVCFYNDQFSINNISDATSWSGWYVYGAYDANVSLYNYGIGYLYNVSYNPPSQCSNQGGLNLNTHLDIAQFDGEWHIYSHVYRNIYNPSNPCGVLFIGNEAGVSDNSQEFIDSIALAFEGYLYWSDELQNNQAYVSSLALRILTGSIFDSITNDGLIASGADQAFDEGYDEGFEAGKNSVDAQSIYNRGYADGQNVSQIVTGGINGFLTGFSGFIDPFLSLGFGNFTVRSVLGILLTFSLVMFIVKIVRG